MVATRGKPGIILAEQIYAIYGTQRPGFEPQVGQTFDFICKNKNKKDSIVESTLQRG